MSSSLERQLDFVRMPLLMSQKRSSLLKKSPGTTAAVVLVLLGRLARH
jgi:hypothetical protein